MLVILFLISSASAAQISVGDGSFAVASGDMLELSGFANGSSNAWMWLFTFEEDASIHGAPISVIGDNYKTNVVNITKLPEGRYPLVIEFGGANDLQEVLYTYNNKTFRYEFTSPWRAPAILKPDENPYARIKQVKQYCDLNKKYCDDTFYATNVTIEHPFIKFSDMYQYQYSDIYQGGKSTEKDITKSGLLYVGGTTNMDPKNVITIVLDHNQTVKAVTEQVTPDGYYKWSAFLDISKLRTGSHPIDISSGKTDTITSYLEIGLEKVTPKPTPTPIKVVRNEFISTAGNTIDKPDSEPTITVAPSQFVSVVTPEITPIPTVIPTPNNEPLSNPDIGDKVVAVPTKSNKLPINPFITIIGIGISMFIIMKSKKS